MQGYDVMEEMYNEKTAAMNFVHELCKERPKGNLETFMALCVGVMNEYQVDCPPLWNMLDVRSDSQVGNPREAAADQRAASCQDPCNQASRAGVLARRRGRAPLGNSAGGWTARSWRSAPSTMC